MRIMQVISGSRLSIQGLIYIILKPTTILYIPKKTDCLQILYFQSRKIIEVSNKVILLCDSSKFGKSSYVKIAPLEDIDELITDKNIGDEFIKQFEGIKTKLTVV